MRGRILKYKMVESDLAEKIRKEFRPGDLLPSESALAREYGVSKKTIFLAVESLKKYGLLRSEPKIGNYAVPMPQAKNAVGKKPLVLYAKREENSGAPTLQWQKLIGSWDDYMLGKLRHSGCSVRLIPAHQISEGTVSPKMLEGIDAFLFSGMSVSFARKESLNFLWDLIGKVPGMIFMKEDGLPVPCSQVFLDLNYAVRLCLEQTRNFPVDGCVIFYSTDSNNDTRAQFVQRNAEIFGVPKIQPVAIPSRQNIYRRMLELAEECRGKLIFVTSDMLSADILRALETQKMRPSVDFHLCSIDDMESLGVHPFSDLEITTIRYDRKKICDLAFEGLLQQLRKADPQAFTARVLVRSTLSIRRSAFAQRT